MKGCLCTMSDGELQKKRKRIPEMPLFLLFLRNSYFSLGISLIKYVNFLYKTAQNRKIFYFCVAQGVALLVYISKYNKVSEEKLIKNSLLMALDFPNRVVLCSRICFLLRQHSTRPTFTLEIFPDPIYNTFNGPMKPF